MSDTLLNQSPDSGGPPGPPQPDPYANFQLPEHTGIDDEVGGQFKALAKELGLKPDGARRLIDLYSAANQRLHDGWRNQTAGDRELGGYNLARNVATAGKAIDKFGGPELRKALDATGAGNHPEVVRFFYRVGKALSEDGLVRPTHGRVSKSYGETFYPKHYSKE
jgi:hypothetical protein